MRPKSVLLTGIVLVVVLSLTITPVRAISPILQNMVLMDNVERGCVGAKAVTDATGRIIVFASNNPDPALDTAVVLAFCHIPEYHEFVIVQLVSLDADDPVRYYETYMMIWGYFDVYVNGELYLDDEYGYFRFDGEDWNVEVSLLDPIPPIPPYPFSLTHLQGQDPWYARW